METNALVIEDLEKYFPVPQRRWRAWLNPFAPLTYPALLRVSFEVGAGDALPASASGLPYRVAGQKIWLGTTMHY
jgi:hypothetical protein